MIESKDLCLEAFPQDDLDGGIHLETFIDKLRQIANKTIPKSNPNPKKPQKSWFCDECKQVILDRKRFLRVFKRSPMNANLQENRSKNGKTITQPRDIAITIGEAIFFNSSSAHYSSKFQRIKNRQERNTLIFQSHNTEPYNQPFSIDERRTVPGKAHDTAPIPDSIHYRDFETSS